MNKHLTGELRNQLAKTVQEARRVSEVGARQAIRMLAVDRSKPHKAMAEDERDLRRRLRAHGRQLGDRRDPKTGAQEIERLTQEVAYEHWHRMLFARFLAENQLLIEPDSGVAVSLDECEELARERAQDRWTLAGSFAERMLPRIFRPDGPALEVKLAPEIRQALERLIESLPAEVFTATDSLGWVYQFWQSEKKNEVNRSGVKIGADEMPAVTQLFTEPYMVSFLLDNSLGAWWAAHRLKESDWGEAGSEAELRQKVAIPGVPLDYLRFVRDEDTSVSTRWGLASEAFKGWPEHLRELKVLDPCCGSGHFLVAAFSMLVPLRMAREGLAAHDAVDAVLRQNLYGLELDPRCVELAAFALALAAWTYPGAGGYRPLPELNLACSGLAPNSTKQQWLALAEPVAAAGGLPPERDLFGVDDSLLSAPVRNSLDALYDLFAQAPTLGSLIEPSTLRVNLFQADFKLVRTLLMATLEKVGTSEEQTERAVAAQGMARAAELLTGRYHWMITNVPYLARGKQDEKLRAFCGQHHPAAKNDLATVFLQRCLELCAEGGTASLVLPQNWLFLTSYRKLREKLLKRETWHLLARLGEGGFESSAAAGAFVALLTLSRGHPGSRSAGLSGEATAAGTMYGLDVSESRTAGEKAARLPEAEIKGVEQAGQLKNPDARVVFEEMSGKLLASYSVSYQGIKTGDDAAKRRCFWEQRISNRWVWLQTTVKDTTGYGGMHGVLDWQYTGSDMARLQGVSGWGHCGIAISQMRELPVALFRGDRFDSNVSALPVKESAHLPAIWCFCSSSEYHRAVRRIDQTLKVTNATLVKVPFNLDHWTKVANQRYPNGLPRPHSDDPTQWIFHGHPCGSVIWDEEKKWAAHGPRRTDTAVLQVAVARLLGHRWPAEQDAGMELAEEQREWVRRCETLFTSADKDGIVCIPSVRGELPASDRLLRLLAAAFSDSWHDSVRRKLLAEAGSSTLDGWLRNRFFDQHCKLFRQRPFIWHLWDGRRQDGFHALVNYHKLAEGGGKGRRCLESVTYSYLGDWINRQRDGVKRGQGGAEGRLIAALELQKRLAAILDGEPPFDLFVRWKPIEEQPIGWEPDINDGVRLNIRPFMADDIPGGRRGAGILRVKPNIHWRKDRGKEPFREQESFPWFWRNGKFMGERVNDVHLATERKRTERKLVEAQS